MDVEFEKPFLLLGLHILNSLNKIKPLFTYQTKHFEVYSYIKSAL